MTPDPRGYPSSCAFLERIKLSLVTAPKPDWAFDRDRAKKKRGPRMKATLRALLS